MLKHPILDMNFTCLNNHLQLPDRSANSAYQNAENSLTELLYDSGLLLKGAEAGGWS